MHFKTIICPGNKDTFNPAKKCVYSVGNYIYISKTI